MHFFLALVILVILSIGCTSQILQEVTGEVRDGSLHTNKRNYEMCKRVLNVEGEGNEIILPLDSSLFIAYPRNEEDDRVQVLRPFSIKIGTDHHYPESVLLFEDTTVISQEERTNFIFDVKIVDEKLIIHDDDLAHFVTNMPSQFKHHLMHLPNHCITLPMTSVSPTKWMFDAKAGRVEICSARGGTAILKRADLQRRLVLRFPESLAEEEVGTYEEFSENLQVQRVMRMSKGVLGKFGRSDIAFIAVALMLLIALKYNQSI